MKTFFLFLLSVIGSSIVVAVTVFQRYNDIREFVELISDPTRQASIWIDTLRWLTSTPKIVPTSIIIAIGAMAIIFIFRAIRTLDKSQKVIANSKDSMSALERDMRKSIEKLEIDTLDRVQALQVVAADFYEKATISAEIAKALYDFNLLSVIHEYLVRIGEQIETLQQNLMLSMTSSKDGEYSHIEQINTVSARIDHYKKEIDDCVKRAEIEKPDITYELTNQEKVLLEQHINDVPEAYRANARNAFNKVRHLTGHAREALNFTLKKIWMCQSKIALERMEPHDLLRRLTRH